MKRELPVLIVLLVLVALCTSVWPGVSEDGPRAPHAAPPASAAPETPPPAPVPEIVGTRCSLRLIPGRIPLVIVDWRGRVFAKHPAS